MCGIVGYIGPEPAADFLLAGLRRLEYRGYDSSGIVTVERGQLSVAKAAGRVDELGCAAQTQASARDARRGAHPLGDARPRDR
jgi:glucosamine 6-phosphate synthetase-like amidotransferase/phosphosugar isomerase protein